MWSATNTSRTRPRRRLPATVAQKTLTVLDPIHQPKDRRVSFLHPSQAIHQQLAQPFHPPVAQGVGGIVQHLADHLTSDPRVRRPLDLHQCRHTVLIHEQVVQGPPAGPVGLIRNTHLTTNQQPPRRIIGVNLPTAKEIRMLLKQYLQDLLSVIGHRAHRPQLPAVRLLNEDLVHNLAPYLVPRIVPQLAAFRPHRLLPVSRRPSSGRQRSVAMCVMRWTPASRRPARVRSLAVPSGSRAEVDRGCLVPGRQRVAAGSRRRARGHSREARR